MPNLLESLKIETRSHHAQIEKKLNLLRPEMDLKAYSALLFRFLGFYRPLEEVLKRSKLPLNYSDRYKSDLLIKDLLYLGDLSDPRLIPQAEIGSMSTPEEILGVLYVIEGSTLGGQILSAYYSKKFHLNSQEGLFFFSGYGETTMSKWLEFQQVLLKFSSPTADLVIIDFAKKTFTALETWMVSSVKM